MFSKEDIQTQIIEHYRHLQKLLVQQAKRGIDTPPYVLTEIEDIQDKIKGLEARLKELDARSNPQPSKIPAKSITPLLHNQNIPTGWLILLGVLICAGLLAFGVVINLILSTSLWQAKDPTTPTQVVSIIETATPMPPPQSITPSMATPTNIPIVFPTSTSTPVAPPTDTPAPATPTLSPAPPPPPVPIQTKSEQFFTFALMGCVQSGETVVCDFVITNNGKDRKIDIYRGLFTNASKLYDNLGNEYRADGSQIANKTGTSNVLILSNVPTPAKVIFEDVSTQANSIALLLLGGNVEEWFALEFRDVPLIKQ
jgi:hypothetical protein